jgi:hypothetical protein
MLRPFTLKILAGLLCAYALLSLPAWVGPSFFEEISIYVYMTPIFSIYFFHYIGVPGLLEHNGYCGWGVCSPTAWGWTFLVLFWVGTAWLVAWGIATLISRPGARIAR